MIKPRTQNFRMKVMLIKLEAVNNRVATRCHATIMIGTIEITQTVMSKVSKPILSSRKMSLSLTVKLNSNICRYN